MTDQSLGGNSSLYDEAQRAGREDEPMEIEREFSVAIFTVRFWMPTGVGDEVGKNRYATAQLIMQKAALDIQASWQKNFPLAGYRVSVNE